MQLDIGMVFSSLIGLFLLMGVGWVSVKTKIVPPSASAPMSSLLLKVTLPCTIFSSLATREFDSAFLVDGVIIIVIGLVLFPLYAALSWGISTEERGKVLNFGLVESKEGYASCHAVNLGFTKTFSKKETNDAT